MLFKKILCAVDFGDSSRAAMLTAAKLAGAADGDLVLLHVYSVPRELIDGPVTDPLVLERVTKEVARTLGRWKEAATEEGAPRVTTLDVEGVAWNEIVRVAKEQNVDLVVVGTHGRTGLEHVLLGSVAERVVRHAHCPVLVTRGT